MEKVKIKLQNESFDKQALYLGNCNPGDVVELANGVHGLIVSDDGCIVGDAFAEDKLAMILLDTGNVEMAQEYAEQAKDGAGDGRIIKVLGQLDVVSVKLSFADRCRIGKGV